MKKKLKRKAYNSGKTAAVSGLVCIATECQEGKEIMRQAQNLGGSELVADVCREWRAGWRAQKADEVTA